MLPGVNGGGVPFLESGDEDGCPEEAATLHQAGPVPTQSALLNFMPTDTNAAMGGGVTCAAVLLVRLAPPPPALSPRETGGL